MKPALFKDICVYAVVSRSDPKYSTVRHCYFDSNTDYTGRTEHLTFLPFDEAYMKQFTSDEEFKAHHPELFI